MSVERRLPSGFIKMLRQFLIGLDRTENNRYSDEMSSRNPPPPDLPPGPNHRLSDVYYYHRNAKGEVVPAERLNKKHECTGNVPSAPVPGCTHHWDEHCYSMPCKITHPVEKICGKD